MITHEARKLADFFSPGCDCDACKIQKYYGLALDVVDAANRLHVDFLFDNGAAVTIADWRELRQSLDNFREGR